jgi:O-acetylhomoserine/O-acetylserine sulfhydrylase-like pyridoxal-dependent enzyme
VYLKRLGITVKFVPDDGLEAFVKAIDSKTKAIYVESIGNPKYNVAPIPELASVRTNICPQKCTKQATLIDPTTCRSLINTNYPSSSTIPLVVAGT